MALGALCIGISVQAEDVQFVLSAASGLHSFPQTEQGYWTETLSCLGKYQHLDIGLFRMTHNVSENPEQTTPAFAWNGFIVCTNGSDANMLNDGGWVANQYGCMAGGGIVGVSGHEVTAVTKGAPYFLGYWASFYDGTLDEHICNISFSTPRSYKPQGVFICPAPWAYYGNAEGDGFARPLDREGDIETLVFHGVDAQGNEVASVTHILAQAVADGSGFRCEQSPDWRWVDLSSLGEVKSVYVTMTTTDADPVWGPNSAMYFCMDRMTVAAEANLPKPDLYTCVLAQGVPTFTWSPVDGATSYNVYLDGELEAYGVEGTQYIFNDLDTEVEHIFGIQAADNATGAISAIASLALTLGGIEEIGADENAPVEYYTLQGVRVLNPSAGLYICRRGTSATKILLP